MKLLQRYFRVLILVLSMGLIGGSCSSQSSHASQNSHGSFSDSELDVLRKVAKKYKYEDVSLEDYEKVKQNIIAFREKGFIETYWPAAVFCLLWVGWGGV